MVFVRLVLQFSLAVTLAYVASGKWASEGHSTSQDSDVGSFTVMDITPNKEKKNVSFEPEGKWSMELVMPFTYEVWLYICRWGLPWKTSEVTMGSEQRGFPIGCCDEIAVSAEDIGHVSLRRYEFVNKSSSSICWHSLTVIYEIF